MEEEIIYNIEVKGVESLDSLTKANKELREERKKVNLQTEEGQKRIQEINKQIDQNNKIIKENSSALEKQRLNVGNYGGALDKLVPGLGATIQGIKGMTTASLAFLATPIGAVIGALGLALGALTAYFKGSEEGQNAFNKITKVTSVILGNLLDIVRDVGGAIFKLITGDFKGFISDIKGTFENLKGIISETNKEIQEGLAIEDLRARADVLERELIVQRELLAAKIAENKLRAEDKSLDLQTRINFLKEANAAQNELSAKEQELAQARFDIKKRENALSDSTKEDLKEEAELEAALFRIQKDNSDKRKEIFTKEQDLRKQLADRQKSLEQERVEEELEFNIQISNEKVDLLADETARIEAQLDEQYEAQRELNEKKRKSNEEYAAWKAENDQAEFERNRDFALQSLGLAAAIFGKNKGFSTAAALASTYLSAQKAFESQFKPIADVSSPIRGTIAAALAVSQGLARVAAINNITFAAGGGSFMTKGPTMLVVGDNPGGVERVDVTPVSGKGRTTVGQGMIKMAGGGTLFAGGSQVLGTVARNSEFQRSQREIFDAIGKLKIVATIEDINEGQSRVLEITDRASI